MNIKWERNINIEDTQKNCQHFREMAQEGWQLYRITRGYAGYIRKEPETIDYDYLYMTYDEKQKQQDLISQGYQFISSDYFVLHYLQCPQGSRIDDHQLEKKENALKLNGNPKKSALVYIVLGFVVTGIMMSQISNLTAPKLIALLSLIALILSIVVSYSVSYKQYHENFAKTYDTLKRGLFKADVLLLIILVITVIFFTDLMTSGRILICLIYLLFGTIPLFKEFMIGMKTLHPTNKVRNQLINTGYYLILTALTIMVFIALNHK